MLIRNFAVTLLAVLGLGWAVTASSAEFDSNRPYPPQPDVSRDVAMKILSQKIGDLQVYVSDRVMHYDTKNITARNEEFKKKNGRDMLFKDTSVVLDPPAGEAADSAEVIRAFKKYLDDAGFHRVETPCETCLIALADFAEYQLEGKVYVFQPRARVYFMNEEFLISREDRQVTWRKGWVTLPGSSRSDALALAGKRMGEEMVQALIWRLASLRQQVSAAEQVTPTPTATAAIQ